MTLTNSKILRRCSKNEGGFVFIFSLVILVFLSIMSGAAFLRSQVELKQTDQRRAVHQAMYAAEAGIDRAIFELRRAPAWKPGESGFPPVTDVRLTSVPGNNNTTVGFYSVEVIAGEPELGFKTVWVKSVGTDAYKEVNKAVVGWVMVENPTRFLISTLGNLRINSGAHLKADLLGKDINFDVNYALPDADRKIVVEKDVFYIKSIDGKESGFTPPPDVTIGGTVQKTPSLTFAGVELDRYKKLATDLQGSGKAIYKDGDLNVNFDAVLANPNDTQPILIYATGNVTVSGTYKHSLLVVAGKNIKINGNIKAQQLGSEQAPQLGLFAAQDVEIPTGVSPNLTVEAFVVADGQGASEGTFIAQGAKSSLNSFNFKGSIAVRGEGRTSVDLNAFIKRNYDYNSALATNLTIPFSSFLANIICWQEVNPNDPFDDPFTPPDSCS